MDKKIISDLLNDRDRLIKKNSEDKRIDLIQRSIEEEIRKNFNDYEVDFILETWTRFGAAPCLMYDDNGFFAVSGDGYNPVVWGKRKIEGTMCVFLTKDQWKKTIREALRYYIMPKKKPIRKSRKNQNL